MRARDLDAQPVPYVPESGQAAVLTGQHHPAGPGVPVGRERAKRVVVVQLVVVPVLQRAVGVDA